MSDLNEEVFSVTKELYLMDKMKWARKYYGLLTTTFEAKEIFDEELYSEILDIVYEQYDINPSEWAEEYLESISDAAGSIREDVENQKVSIEKLIGIQKEILDITKMLHLKDSAKWAKVHIQSFLLNEKYTLLKI